MDKGLRVEKAWIAEDGSYGSGPILFIDNAHLSNEQWENVSAMADSDKYEYAEAILNDDDSTVRKIELDNFGEHWGLD